MRTQLLEEKGFIQFGQRHISFAVVRSHRRKTVALAVDPMDGVIFSAPDFVSIAKLETLAKEKGAWIIKNLRHHAELESLPVPREYVSGETFSYLGRHLLLKVTREKEHREATCKVSGRFMIVTCPAGIDKSDLVSAVRAALVEWYKDHAEKKISERVTIYASKLGVPVNKVLIKEQQKRWGSCDKHGHLRFNWRVIMAPIALVDYVVAHELCHLKIKDHSAEFWKLLGMVMPDYEERRERLRKVGGSYFL